MYVYCNERKETLKDYIKHLLTFTLSLAPCLVCVHAAMTFVRYSGVSVYIYIYVGVYILYEGGCEIID